MSEETYRNQLNRHIAAVHAMDVEATIELLAEDVIVEDPYGSPPMEGKAAARQFLNEMYSAFESVDLRADHLFISGNAAAGKFTITGKGKNGRDITAEGIEVYEFDEAGLIRRVAAYWDQAAMIADLQS